MYGQSGQKPLSEPVCTFRPPPEAGRYRAFREPGPARSSLSGALGEGFAYASRRSRLQHRGVDHDTEDARPILVIGPDGHAAAALATACANRNLAVELWHVPAGQEGTIDASLPEMLRILEPWAELAASLAMDCGLNPHLVTPVSPPVTALRRTEAQPREQVPVLALPPLVNAGQRVAASWKLITAGRNSCAVQGQAEPELRHAAE